MRHLWCSYGYRCLLARGHLKWEILSEVTHAFLSKYFINQLQLNSLSQNVVWSCSFPNFFQNLCIEPKKNMLLYETLFQAKKDVTWYQIVWTVLTNMTAFAKTTLKFLTRIEFVTAILIATISQTNLDAIGKMKK